MMIIICFSEAYDDSIESKKSRRQLCSNLFEHLFTQSGTESPTSTEQSLPPTMALPPPSLIPNANNPVKPTPPLPPPTTVAPVPSQSQPSAQFAQIESFQQVE